MFSLICAWTNNWANKGDATDFRRHRAHYDVTVITLMAFKHIIAHQITARSWLPDDIDTSLLALCVENSFVVGGFPAQKSTMSCIWWVPDCHDDVIKWKHFPRYWAFVREIHRSPVNSPHKGQWRGALMLSLICARINGWVNNGEAHDLRLNQVHCDVIVMIWWVPDCI